MKKTIKLLTVLFVALFFISTVYAENEEPTNPEPTNPGSITINNTINNKYFDSRKYYSQFEVKNLYTFINAGVLVINSKKLREDFTSDLRDSRCLI